MTDKIALFRSLFRGREDVYALRWESADGKSGYSPASIRDWKAVMSVPPAERKKLDQATRQLLPLTDDAIHQHLSGKNTIGVYLLLADETCWFLAVDFDQESWKLDAVSFVESCREMNVPAALERSRSGERRACVDILQCPGPGILARKLGAGLVTRTMQRRHQISLKSYDRLFPNQDTMPTGDSETSSPFRCTRSHAGPTTASLLMIISLHSSINGVTLLASPEWNPSPSRDWSAVSSGMETSSASG